MFESRGIRVRRHANIGSGHLIKPSSLGKEPKYVAQVMNPKQVTENYVIRKSKSTPFGFKPNLEKPGELDGSQEEDSQFVGDPRVFHCRNPMCSRIFLTMEGLEAHQSGLSDCIGNKRKESIEQYVKRAFISKFGISENPQTFSN